MWVPTLSPLSESCYLDWDAEIGERVVEEEHAGGPVKEPHMERGLELGQVEEVTLEKHRVLPIR